MQKRDPSIELFRCLLMYGIVLLHCWHHCGVGFWCVSIVRPCLVGFVFISGWFGLHFMPSKVLKLYGVQLYCILIAMFLSHLSGGEPVTVMSIVRGMCGFWFVHAYVILMMIAPLVDHALESLKNTRGPERSMLFCTILLPPILAIFGLGFIACSPLIGRFVPHPEGLGNFGVLTLLGIYLGARILRSIAIDRIVTTRTLFVFLFAALFFVSLAHLSSFNSPFCFIVAAALFLIVRKLPMNRTLGRIVLVVSPSMFSVYFLHLSGSFMTRDMAMAITEKTGCWLAAAGMAASVCSFVACVGLDVPRRLLVRYMHFEALCLLIDSLYARGLKGLVSSIQRRG